MAKKKHNPEPITSIIRQAFEQCGKTRYQISQESGVDQTTLSRFARGLGGLNTASLDKLAPVLGLQLTIVKRAKP